MIRYLAALAVLIVGLAACGGGSDGWTDEQRETYIKKETARSGVSRDAAECYADETEKRYPTYAEYEAEPVSEEFIVEGFEILARCGT